MYTAAITTTLRTVALGRDQNTRVVVENYIHNMCCLDDNKKHPKEDDLKEELNTHKCYRYTSEHNGPSATQ